MHNTRPLPPLSLYIHIPWCIQKCPYCDFNSHAAPLERIPAEAYIQRLQQEWQLRQPMLQQRGLHSIFIGGGTPSLIDANLLGQLLDTIKAQVPVAAEMEVTMEANPGAIDSKQFGKLRAAGINRLSIGIQTFNQHHLKTLGRIHNSAQSKGAVQQARDAGIENINLDIMHGLPQQTLAEAESDLHQAIELQPQHISWYQLTIEANTYFARFPPQIPDDDSCAAIQDSGQQLLAAAGYRKYEVSAYSQPGRQCQHNLNYWQFGDYLGIGAGAHSKLTLADGSIWRQHNIRHPKHYLKTPLVLQTATCDDSTTPSPLISTSLQQHQMALRAHDLRIEYMLCRLRLPTPIDAQNYEAYTGLSWHDPTLQRQLQQAAALGLIEQQGMRIHSTAQGQRYLNSLLELFLSEQSTV